MKIGVISDLHLGHRNSNIEVLKDVLLFFQDKVNMIIDCGDITDNNIINPIQLNELYDVFRKISIPYYIVKGNHDSLNNKTIAKILELNPYIYVAEDIHIMEVKGIKLLFIPYTNNLSTMFKYLDDNNIYGDYAFSHLNITSNVYSDISFDNPNKLFKYSYFWLNGHIHTPESYSSVFGKIENVGSLSSLTYGDEHIPTYGILDTYNNSFTRYEINNCIIHKTCNTDFDFDRFQKENINRHINWRIKLPSNFFVEDRQKIKNKLQNYPNTLNIQFDLKNDNKSKIKTSKYNNKRTNLLEQLFESYEKDNNTTLHYDIKKGLTNDKL